MKNSKSQIPNYKPYAFRALKFGELELIWNLVFGAWNL